MTGVPDCPGGERRLLGGSDGYSHLDRAAAFCGAVSGIGLRALHQAEDDGQLRRKPWGAGSEFLVVATGVQMAVGSLMVALGVWPDLGALILFLFLIPTAFWMHAFWKESEPRNRAMEQVQFYKDLALAGAALVMFAAFAALGHDIGPVITGPLFNVR
ncbi:DoxX family protein [Arthrobacter sp. ISL-28]|uniref:DoxX family protein n=1 Tax=Arthrobacter sp. ISL-28 TaxID=2819108 RepID=UPI002036098E|nr:DoxX family protein [Arthrobacter sp. ISL-28]